MRCRAQSTKSSHPPAAATIVSRYPRRGFLYDRMRVRNSATGRLLEDNGSNHRERRDQRQSVVVDISDNLGLTCNNDIGAVRPPAMIASRNRVG